MTFRPHLLALAAASLLLTAADHPRPPPLEAPAPAPAQLEPAPEEPRPVRSCRVDARTCIDWEGTFAGVDLPARCRKLKGAWSDAACPAAPQVATCAQREPSGDERTVIRSYPPASAADARAACQKLPRAVFMKR